jgi:hemerythrin superfamily protein
MKSAWRRSMDAIELLKRQHRFVEELFEQIDQEGEDEEEKVELVQELADNLAAHAAIEERIFYPAAYADNTRDLLEEAVEEHLALKRVIADLVKMAPSDDYFDAKIGVLKEQVAHHVEEEEKKLFPKVLRELSASYLEDMGTEMEALFDEMMSDDPSAYVPEEIEHAAPLRPKRSRPGA